MGFKDWWNNRSYLVKGGLIGLIVGLIPIFSFPNSYFFAFIYGVIADSMQGQTTSWLIISNILILFKLLEKLFYWFLIGALFGWILEKRKFTNKKGIYTTIIVILGILVLGGIVINISFPRITTVYPDEDMQIALNNLFENRTSINNGGACVWTSKTGGPKICEFTTKENCNGNFNQGLLCTAEQLGTECGPTTRNLIIETENYFIDSCGNQANPYDMSQYENKSYWTNSIN